MRPTEYPVLAALLRAGRVAALGTLREGAPYVSMVTFAAEDQFEAVLLHLSTLAPHTRQLLADPRVSLLVAEPDHGQRDPQTLARLTLVGTVAALPSAAPDYAAARAHYLARLPDAAPLFELGDFALYRLVIAEARYVGGFARAYTLTPADLRRAAQATQ